MNLIDLKKKIPFKWKIQSVSKDGKSGSFVAYIDARDVMNLLDEVVGPENWQDKYEMKEGKLIAGVGIIVHINETTLQPEWVWKYDTGTESSYEAEKGIFSDAFKRAAVKWGVGRFLYDLEIIRLPINSFKKPMDERGVEIKDINAYLANKKQGKTVETVQYTDDVLPPMDEDEAHSRSHEWADAPTPAQEGTPCSKCEIGVLKKKTGRYGEFLGCSRFPDCKHIVK